MKFSCPVPTPAWGRALVAASAVAACASASALPVFTFNAAAAGLNGGTQFSADNMLISDFAHVTYTGPTSFTQSGYSPITGFQLNASSVATPGLNTTYGLYIAYTATGNQTFGTAPGFYGGDFTSLSYTIYGYNGTGSFTPTSAPVPTVTLGSGTLDASNSSTFQGTLATNGAPSFVTASLYLTFAASPSQSAFFVSPSPFYTLGEATFSHTRSTITNITANGFDLRQGGGAFNFDVSAVPEPETYALLLAGLAAIGFTQLRRRSGL